MNGIPGLIRFADERLLPSLLNSFYEFHAFAIRLRGQESFLLRRVIAK